MRLISSLPTLLVTLRGGGERSGFFRAHESANELPVIVQEAGTMGKGTFAAEAAPAGTWVCKYVGTPVTLLQTTQRYASEDPEYLFQITPDLYLDAMDSTHFSRYFNHAQHGNLNFTIDVVNKRVDFMLSRDVEKGEQLTFDYGMSYWLGSGVTPLGDDRNFTRPTPKAAKLTGPRPVTPKTATELAIALALPEEEARLALLRCLEYFGVSTRLDEQQLKISFGFAKDARQEVVDPLMASVETLHEATAACIAQAAPAAAAAEQAVADVDPDQAALAAKWLANCPPFATAEEDAVSVALLLLWTFPEAHGATRPLSREQWETSLAALRRDENGESAEGILQELASSHADQNAVDTLMVRARALVEQKRR